MRFPAYAAISLVVDEYLSINRVRYFVNRISKQDYLKAKERVTVKKVLLILVGLVIAAFGFLYWQNSQAPALGVVNGKLKPLSTRPNCVSTQTDISEKKVPVLAMKDDIEATMTAIKRAINHYQYGKVSIKAETGDYLYAVFETPTMKWRDDVEFWIDEQNRVVHFRSSSRAGHSDRGLNRQRYEQLAESYTDL